jgi:hyperosmotically inducible periplasmic protein
MRRLLKGLVVGILIGAGGMWYYMSQHRIPDIREAERRAVESIVKGRIAAEAGAERAKQALAARLEALELRAEDVRGEFSETGRIVRRRARDLGEAIADTASDARTTAAIKAKLAADPELSALSISVDTTGGRVTLSGTVASPERVGRAVALALDTRGVNEVVSTLQVRGGQGTQGAR